MSTGQINVYLLGVCFMLVFTAFQTGGLIQQNVLSNIHKEDPSFTANGFLSFSMIYGVFALTNWFAPSLIETLTPRASMVLAAITYNIFIAQFLFPTTVGLYAASALVGAGAALIWTAQGTFLTQNSTKESMSRNSGIFWAMMQFSLIWGNIFVYFKFNGRSEIDASTRTVVYGVLTVVGIIGNILMLFLRKAQFIVEDDVRPPFTKGIKDSFALLKTSNMILLSMAFIYTGLELSFFSGVYGACIGFTRAFGADSKKYVPLSGIIIGSGEVLSGLAFSLLGEKTKRFGRGKIVGLGLIAHLIAYAIAFVNLPYDSPFADTSEEAIIESRIDLAFLGSFLLGFGDGCFNTQIYSLIGIAYSEDSAPAFALFKFMQSIAAAVAFYASSELMLPYQLAVLFICAVFGTITFCIVSKRCDNKETDELSE